jgi:hypothetical protein
MTKPSQKVCSYPSKNHLGGEDRQAGHAASFFSSSFNVNQQMHAIKYVIPANVEVMVSVSSFGQTSLKQIMHSCNQDDGDVGDIGDIQRPAVACLDGD